jgi:hypothetical protein
MRVVCHYLDLRQIFYVHIPNESVRHRSAGTRAGAPDLLIFDRVLHDPECRGVAIELKRTKGGKVSEAQESFLLKLRSRYWQTYICWGATEAIKVIDMLWQFKEDR